MKQGKSLICVPVIDDKYVDALKRKEELTKEYKKEMAKLDLVLKE